MKPTLQTSMNQFLKPNAPTIDDSEIDARVVMCCCKLYMQCTGNQVVRCCGAIPHRGGRHFMPPPLGGTDLTLEGGGRYKGGGGGAGYVFVPGHPGTQVFYRCISTNDRLPAIVLGPSPQSGVFV